MQFDFFDKKVKEAADQHHPSYDENAWKKMEQLLDKHLPQEKDDRRRIFFFLLLFFLLLGGAYIIIGKPWKSNKTLAVVEKRSEQQVPLSKSENNLSGDQVKPDQIIVDNNKQQDNLKPGNENIPAVIKTTQQQQLPPVTTQNRLDKLVRRITKPLVPKNFDADITKQASQNNVVNTSTLPEAKLSDNSVVTAPANNNNDQKTSIAKEESARKPVNENTVVPKEENVIANNNSADKRDEVVTNKPDIKKNAGKNKKNQYFSLSISGGPDVSKAGSSSLSKVTASYGAGIGYTLNKFTLRSGFYIAKKIYSAGADDYKLDYTLPANIKLLSVDADCKVYEIPLSLTYNLGNRKKSNWYAGIGLSSYFMKKEKYNNWYKNTTSGSVYPRSYNYAGKNKHYFSVLDLSAGYSYRLNNTFSLSAEPYLRIPMQGIGEGKVKLNSAGILFSVGIRPFNSGKKSK